MSSDNIVHVAVAVIQNKHGQILIAKRPEDSHQGGLWEFPGGKVEQNESVQQALSRELFEETGIKILDSEPLIRIHHCYTDKTVLLDVWCVVDFTGDAHGKEGQQVAWVSRDSLSEYTFPKANLPIINAINLPDKYMITGSFNSKSRLVENISYAVDQGVKLIQFRAPQLDVDSYFRCAKLIYENIQIDEVRLLLNTSHELYINRHAYNFSHGLHLNSKEIKSIPSEQRDYLTSTSIHDLNELRYAEDKNIDLVLLSPVKHTLSHPDRWPIGWEKFKEITDNAKVPVYALGGMTRSDIPQARLYGGQGIAAISDFWSV